MDTDITIIGARVIGLAIASETANNKLNKTVEVVLPKESFLLASVTNNDPKKDWGIIHAD